MRLEAHCRPCPFLSYLCPQLTLCWNLKLTGTTRNIDATHTDTTLKDFEIFLNLYKSKSVVVQ